MSVWGLVNSYPEIWLKNGPRIKSFLHWFITISTLLAFFCRFSIVIHWIYIRYSSLYLKFEKSNLKYTKFHLSSISKLYLLSYNYLLIQIYRTHNAHQEISLVQNNIIIIPPNSYQDLEYPRCSNLSPFCYLPNLKILLIQNRSEDYLWSNEETDRSL